MSESRTVPTRPWASLDREGSALSVHDFLTTRLSALMTALRRQVTMPYASDFGLSITEWRVLSLVAHAGTLAFSDLVAQSTSDKALISRTTRKLEMRNLLAINPESETAKKRIACSITPEGKALYEEVIVIARRRQAEILNSLTQDEREALFSTIEKLQQVLAAEEA